jgi:hypothetical protein
MQDRCAVRGTLRRSGLEPIRKDGGDALVIERADLDRPSGDRFRTVSCDAAVEAQDAEAGTKALFRMGPSGSTAMISASVLGPIARAWFWKRSGVHSA